MGFANVGAAPQKLTTAVFVDAGYLFAAGGTALFGSFRKRQGLSLETPDTLVQQILNLGHEQIGQPLGLLRTYWYDGAQDGVPTPALKVIAALPRFKIRLGRLSGGGQKGVDGLIILDLINLSLNRVIDVAILLSGDEDLRETVLFAQGHGVTVVVAGVPSTARSNQSDTLVREADFHLILPAELLATHIVETQAPLITGTTSTENGYEGGVEDAQEIVEETAAPVGVTQIEDGALETLAIEMVSRTDFILETFDGRVRLASRCDRALIGQLIQLTQTNPVAESILRRARAKCIEVASRK
ncbi:MAG: NYN domain-containing protein [Acidimicrobiales bacterium]